MIVASTGETLPHIALSNIAQNPDLDSAEDRSRLGKLFEQKDRRLALGALRSNSTAVAAKPAA